MRTATSFTTYGWLLCFWVLIIPFQYGYHISVLNQLQSVLSCKQAHLETAYGLPTCIPMTDLTFSFVTSIFTIGGLAGSLSGNFVMEKYGRKGGARASALLVSIGSGLMGLSGGIPALGIGRFLVGVGSGVGLCVGPIYISEIAPAKISGTVGILTQLGIVLGIFITQLVGLNFATPTTWRFVLFISCALGLAQWFGSVFMVETPGWISAHSSAGSKEEAAAVERRIWGFSPSSSLEASSEPDTDETAVNHPLLAQAEPDDATHIIHAQATISLPTLIFRTPRDLYRPMVIVCFAMVGQQVSGINAVLYYSNANFQAILSKALPDMGPYVSLGITIVNVLMTFAPIVLVERLGRKQLLTISTICAIASLMTVGIALDSNWTVVASVAIITFVMSFAIGLGPIPASRQFILIPEVGPFYAVSALASLALSLNWIANFLVSLAFLPMRNYLSGGDPMKEGRVFFVFVGVLALVMGVVRVSYR
ncbi:general substrate transporter [Mycena floridula]|nr:general substrate transporter [Mycena floridula]